MTIQFFGTRGSSPLSGEQYNAFGGATTCVLLRFSETYIMVDCGSGAAAAAEGIKDAAEVHLFISHTHLDHISGIVDLIPACAGKKLHIYGMNHGGYSVRDDITRLMSAPFWPIGPDYLGNIIYHEIPEGGYTKESPLMIGDIRITTMESNHPGGCTLYRMDETGADGSIISSAVTAWDFNHADGYGDRLAQWAQGADVLIYDGMMTEEEYALHPDWGHSTPERGIVIAQQAGVKKLYITHHGRRTDDELSEYEERLRKHFPKMLFARSGMRKDRLGKMLEVGLLLTSERDFDRLLELILRAALDITGADAGTLYMKGEEGLIFRIMITKSMNYFKGGKGDPIDLPPVKYSLSNVCAASVIEDRLINIPDVYHSTEYDFSGPRNYDKLTGYRTQSVMVVPMDNDFGEIIGALELINATDAMGNIVSFSEDDEKVVESLASLAAVCLTNMNYSQEVVDLLYSFVRVMSAGIDARTPYNANHTRNMVRYGDKFLTRQNESGGRYTVSDEERREILISMWLHDIGKLIIPLEVMDKSTRLGDDLQDVEYRFERRRLLARIERAEGRISEEEYTARIGKIADDIGFIRSINTAGFLPDEKYERVCAIGAETYEDEDGTKTPVLTEAEINKLSIRKGTLTADEREVMQSHVTMTSRMLSEMHFPRGFEKVPFLAGAHHELMNGNGYPNRLKAEDLPWQARLITILDVFEAITAKDRPYKPPVPVEKALAILDDMAAQGQIDPDLLESFKESRAWE